MPAEKDVVPAGRNNPVKHFRRHLRHGDDAHREGDHRENAELDHLGDYHADHAALDHIDGGDGDQNQGVEVGIERRIAA